MSDNNDDRLSGAKDKAVGQGKETWGKLTGDEQTKSEGKMDQAKGDMKQGLADVKDKVDDAVDSVKNRTS